MSKWTACHRFNTLSYVRMALLSVSPVVTTVILVTATFWAGGLEVRRPVTRPISSRAPLAEPICFPSLAAMTPEEFESQLLRVRNALLASSNYISLFELIRATEQIDFLIQLSAMEPK